MDKVRLIHKVISGIATASEKAELSEWIASDLSNKEDFEDIQFAMEGVKNTDAGADSNDPFYKGLRKIESLIEIFKRKDKKIKIYKSVSLILAIVSISLVIFFCVFGWRPSSKIQVTSALKETADNAPNNIVLDNLKFDDTTLAGIINTLEKEYGLIFEVSTEELLSCRFTGTFYRDISIEDVIRTLAQSIGFDYKILKSYKYELRGKGCNI